MVSDLQESYDSLIPFHCSESLLRPVCVYGSMVYNLLHQLEYNIVWFHMSMEEFTMVFCEMFENGEVMKYWNQAEPMNHERNLSFETAFKRSLNIAIIAKLKMLVS